MAETLRQPSAFEIQAQTINQALSESARLLEDSGNDDVLELVNWLSTNSEVSYTQADSMDLSRTRLVRPSGDRSKIAIVTVAEGNSAAREYPRLRYNPMYVPNMNAIFTPGESLAHTGVLSGVLIHEGVHAYDELNPDFQKAHEIFPDMDYAAAHNLLTEIKGHDYEGRFLNAWFGKSFDEYIQTEVDAADKAAIERQKENSGLFIEVGVEPSVVKQHLEATQSFLREEDKDCAMGLLNSALPSYIMLRTIDQIMSRNQDKVSEADIIKIKIGALNAGYVS